MECGLSCQLRWSCLEWLQKNVGAEFASKLVVKMETWYKFIIPDSVGGWCKRSFYLFVHRISVDFDISKIWLRLCYISPEEND